MTDDDGRLGQRLRGQLDVELGEIRAPAGSRERLRRGMRKRRRSPWFRTSVWVPVATALAIAALVLSIPVLLSRDNEVKVVPAGPPGVSVPVSPTPTEPPAVTAQPTPGPRQSATPSKVTPRATRAEDGVPARKPASATPRRSPVDPAAREPTTTSATVDAERDAAARRAREATTPTIPSVTTTASR